MGAERPIRLGIALDNLGVGGTELNAIRTVEHLDRKRYEIHLLTLQNTGPLLPRFLEAGVRVHSFPIRSLWGRTAVQAGLGIRRAARSLDLDILHAHDHYSGVFTMPWVVAARTGAATVVSRRWWVAPSPAHGHLARLTTKLADRVLTNSAALARQLIEREGVAPERIALVPNFVDEDKFGYPSEEERAARRRQLGLPVAALVIGIVARLDPVKDHATLLRALTTLIPEFPTVRLVIIGDGPQRATLEELARSLGVSGAVVFTGERPHDSNLHVSFDVSVLTSLHEGFPTTVIEAMAAARPVIATASGGTVDAVQDQVSGLLFEPGDVEGLRGHLRSLLRDRTLRERLGRAGLEIAKSRYTALAALGKLEALYDDGANLRSSRR